MKKMMLVIVTLLLSGQMTFANVTLTDVEGHWAEEYITDLVEKDIVSGYGDGIFKPDEVITRAEFISATSLYLLNKNIIEYPSVNATYWAELYIRAAINNRIIYPSGIYEALFDKPITRDEMISVIVAAYALKHDLDYNPLMVDVNLDVEESLYTEIESKISDLDESEPLYRSRVVNGYALGFTEGYADGSFNPQGQATRAEACVVLYKLVNEEFEYDHTVNLGTTVSPDNENNEAVIPSEDNATIESN
jgi:hypothetical protein